MFDFKSRGLWIQPSQDALCCILEQEISEILLTETYNINSNESKLYSKEKKCYYMYMIGPKYLIRYM